MSDLRRECLVDPTIELAEDEVGTKGLIVRFLIVKDADALLSFLWDTDNLHFLSRDIIEFEVASWTGDTMDISFRVATPFGSAQYALRREIDRAARVIQWRELSGDLKRIRGSWNIEPTAEGQVSRVTYQTFVAIGRFIPSRLIRQFAKAKMGEMVTRLRQAASSGG